jgi:hypothetical protein
VTAGDGYTAAVSFSTPLITYPEVWYLILSPNFALGLGHGVGGQSTD